MASLENALIKGANNQKYREAVARSSMPDTTRPHANWRNDLIARVGTDDHLCYGNAWKPGARAEPGQLKLEVHNGRRLAHLSFLKSPVDTCEIADATEPAFVLIGEGYVNPSSFVTGYRQINVCAETSPEDIMIAGLLRGVRDSAYARKLGSLNAGEIRRLAQGKVVLQARTAPLGNIGLTNF